MINKKHISLLTLVIFLSLSHFAVSASAQPSVVEVPSVSVQPSVDSLSHYLEQAARSNPQVNADFMLYKASLEKIPQAGASLGAKVSSKAMLTFTSALGLILVFLAIFSSTGTLVNLPVLQQSATGGLSFGFAEVPINAMYLVLVGLCTSIMWGGIFNLAVEGLGKYLAAASGLFMVLVCGGGILPVIQGWVADVAGFMASYWVIIAALAYLLYYGLVGCKNVNKDIPVE